TYFKTMFFILPFMMSFDVFIGKSFFTGDSFFQDYPMRHYLGQSILNLDFPFYAFEGNFGFPFFAEISSGTLYPLNWFFSVIAFKFGFHRWENDIILHIGISGFFFYLYLREEGFNDIISLTGTSAFQVGGYISSHTGHNSLLHSLSWTGMILWTLARLNKSFSLQNIFLFIIGMSLSFLAGSPQMFWMQSIFSLMYFLLVLFPLIQSQISSGSFHLFRLEDILSAIQKNKILFISALILALFSFFQFHHTSLLSEEAARKHWPLDYYFSFSSKFRSFAHLLYGNWFSYFPDFGNSEFSAYSSATVCIFSLFGILYAPKDRFWFFYFFLLCLGILSANADNPVYRFMFSNVSGFGNFRAPGRYILFVQISLIYFFCRSLYIGIYKNEYYRKEIRQFSVLISILLIPVLLFPFYKNSSRLPFSAEGFQKAFPDILIISLSVFIYLLLILRPSGEKILSFLAALIMMDCVLRTENTDKVKNLPKYAIEMKRTIRGSLRETLTDNFDLLSRNYGTSGYLTLEKLDTFKFKEKYYQLTESSKEKIRQVLSASGTPADCGLAYIPEKIYYNDFEFYSSISSEKFKCSIYINSENKQEKALESSYERLLFTEISGRKFTLSSDKKLKGYIFTAFTYSDLWEARDREGNLLKVQKALGNFMTVYAENETDLISFSYRFF
nr:hypothetical protein [Leptospiraceae bacterium]